MRELKNVIDRISIMTHNEVVGKEELPEEIKLGFEGNNKKHSSINLSSFNGKSLDDIVSEIETELIINALKESNDNISKAARLLKIPRETLRYKLTKYGIFAGEN